VIAELVTAAVLLPHVSGAYNRAVTVRTLGQTVCVPGWTRTVRPPASYTSALKLRQMAQWHLPGPASRYEEDHLVALSIGGSPRSPRNLWPQPWAQAHRDDRLELQLHRELCAGRVTLRGARLRMVTWKRSRG
jgi:hypothetical protein